MAQIINIGIKLIRISKEDFSRLEISDNAGISWNLIETNQYIGEFYELAKRNYIIYVSTSEGRFQSVTLGRTWTERR
ncbi:MAG: hypothetical protein JSS94_10840 [Bacteroidetes bacterium]|nr:hypothetical protein [Bacteroidota bacterium]